MSVGTVRNEWERVYCLKTSLMDIQCLERFHSVLGPKKYKCCRNATVTTGLMTAINDVVTFDDVEPPVR
jgi:hypothetical protein